MKIREPLQTELWSKRMTPKILAVSGIFLGIAVIGFVLWVAIDRNWTTPVERNAARSALVKLDGLQDAGFLCDKEFVMRAKLAGTGVDDARKAARTTRDRKIVAELMSYESTIVANHAFQQRQLLAQQRNSSRKAVQWIQGFALAGIGYDGRELHKTLD
ncbi:MAG: hypothetical protein WBE56_11805 [Terracidiphilus sp.]